MQLEELFDYKSQLMSDLLTNEKIVKLLSDDGSVVEDASSLMYEQVFPYEFLPELVGSGRTFICCDVDIQSVSNKTFLTPTMFIWVFTHKSLIRSPSGGIRTDELCAEISRTINGSRFYGLGELNLTSVKRFMPTADFLGKVMVFTAKDYNRPSPSGQIIPGNRKV